jgi:hypothetical protein
MNMAKSEKKERKHSEMMKNEEEPSEMKYKEKINILR